jgi:DNA-binding MarR family transcriptional regulator
MAVDENRVAAWRSVLLAQNRVLRAIDEELAAAGLIPLAWYDVLLELNGAPGRRLRMQELGDRVVLSRSRVSRLVDDLEQNGLVARRPDPDDGRAILACLTPEGRQALRRAAPTYLRGIERHFSSLLTATELRVVASALDKVVRRHRRPAGQDEHAR